MSWLDLAEVARNKALDFLEEPSVDKEDAKEITRLMRDAFDFIEEQRKLLDANLRPTANPDNVRRHFRDAQRLDRRELELQQLLILVLCRVTDIT